MDDFPNRIEPYEGPENYIFISYSHRDSERVFPLLRRLTEEGFRLWYDEGIDPGSEWPESIASHLYNCKVCLAFISPTSVVSNNCKQEINFALANKKDFLSVMLEPVTMPRGMEMQLSIYQFLLSYKYPSREAFEEKLFSVELLQSCRRPKAVSPAPKAAPAAVPTAVPTAAPATAPKTTPTAAPTAAPTTAPTAAPAPAPAAPAAKEKKKAKQPRQKAKAAGDAAPAPKKNKKRLLIVLAFLLLVSALMILKPFQRRVTIGGTTYRNDSWITVRDASVTAEQLEKLSKFDKCRDLNFKDCSFERGALQNLTGLEKLQILSLERCTGVGSLDFLSSTDLIGLTARDCGLTDADVAAVSTLSQLTQLELADNDLSRIPDLEALTKLKQLDLSSNRIESLSPLSACTTLTELYLRGNSVEDLSPLAACKKMERLDLNGNRVRDISALAPFIYLKRLDLGGCDVQSLEPLSSCTLLGYVDLHGCSALKDLSVLEKSADELKYLDICGISGTDLSFLGTCTALETLNMNSCGAKDLSFVSRMEHLRILNAADNALTEPGPLEACTGLAIINLAGNRLNTLSGLPRASVAEGKSAPRLILLLHGNQLTSLTGLDPGYHYAVLSVYDNPLTDGSALSGASGYRLIADMSGALDPAGLTEFTTVYVPEAVLEWQLAWEQALYVRLEYAPVGEALEESLNNSSITGVLLPDNP